MLLVASNGDVRVGQPLVAGARVVAEVVEQGRDPKIIVFKYKAKTRYRRRRGHRQDYTRLAVRQILTAEDEKPKRRRAARPRAEAEGEEAKPARADARPSGRKPRARADARPSGRKAVAEPKAEADVVAFEAETAVTPEAEAKPVRRTRTRKPQAEAEAAVPEAEAAAPEAETVAPEEKPKPAPADARPSGRKPRARKPKAEPEAEAAPETDQTESE